MSAIAAAKGKLIAVIGDEDTCVGFLLGGIGELNKSRQTNFMIAEMIRYVIDAHTKPVPAVLEIPSKDHPYDPNKDSILRRAKGIFQAEEYR
ncbi:v-type proton ATPase subunit F [Caerostris darwini]|uniref:V-type proton ATPase subunit F n=1 Tax=Caerostris darwini TaxID=1538125 RepID=A0AAV4MXZ9_9ARAC|nr:v-type proton ATPase subunit F [Caerostris darwini]